MFRKADLSPETIVFDMVLMDIFEQWRHNVIKNCDNTKPEQINWLDAFCSYVRESLEHFDKADRLKEPLKSQ